MAYVEHASRDDPYTIALLEDAGRKIKDCCQIMTFGRHLVKPEIMGQYLFCFSICDLECSWKVSW